MTFDMNDVAPQPSGELIPDGTFAKVTMSIRKGGTDGASEVDRGLLKRSNQPGSDVLMVDAEFTVAEGPIARRKFWQNFTVQGGKAARELPGIVDQVLTLSLFRQDTDQDGAVSWQHDAEKGHARRLVCQSGNPWGLPAKDRSGKLALTEPADLGALLTKINQTLKG